MQVFIDNKAIFASYNKKFQGSGFFETQCSSTQCVRKGPTGS